MKSIISCFKNIKLIISIPFKGFYSVYKLLIQLIQALQNSKIGIIANSDRFPILESMLKESYAFSETNLKELPAKEETFLLEKVNSMSILVIDGQSYFEDSKQELSDNEIDNHIIFKILNKRNTMETAVIIYAKPTSIPNAMMTALYKYTQVTIVNAKGRLSNDVFLSLLTTKVRIK